MMDCTSSLVESESVPVSSGLELVEICASLMSSLDWLDLLDPDGAGEVGLDSGKVPMIGVILSSL